MFPATIPRSHAYLHTARPFPGEPTAFPTWSLGCACGCANHKVTYPAEVRLCAISAGAEDEEEAFDVLTLWFERNTLLVAVRPVATAGYLK